MENTENYKIKLEATKDINEGTKIIFESSCKNPFNVMTFLAAINIEVIKTFSEERWNEYIMTILGTTLMMLSEKK